jgi:hypothetical protein
MTRDDRVYVRVSDEEFVAIERAARKEGRSVSNWIRRHLLLDLMMLWDHTAMTEIRRRIEEGTVAELEGRFNAEEEKERRGKKRA